MNLLSGSMGVIFTLEGNIPAAFLFMIAAGVFDFADGFAARLLGVSSETGKELDSLCDMVSFGLLPSLMLCQTMAGLSEGWKWFCFLPLVLAAASALRLAKFNLDERQTLSFLGLPTPAAAILCGSLCSYLIADPTCFAARAASFPATIPAVAALLSVLLLCEIPMFSMKTKKDNPLLNADRVVFLIFAAMTVLMVLILGRHWTLAVVLVFLFYILENLSLFIFRR